MELGILVSGVKYLKSIKLSDGQVLIDRKNSKFESWLIDIKEKLKANANHYLTA
jgi:hypothetical protein